MNGCQLTAVLGEFHAARFFSFAPVSRSIHFVFLVRSSLLLLRVTLAQSRVMLNRPLSPASSEVIFSTALSFPPR